MYTISVPLHRLVLESELVSGEVVLAVRPSLPIEGVDVILGNNLVGGRVWPESLPPPIVNTASDLPESDFPEVLTPCVVTGASHTQGGEQELESVKDCASLNLPLLLPTLSCEEVVAAHNEVCSPLFLLKDWLEEVKAHVSVLNGTYSVARRMSDYDYLLDTPDRKRSKQLCHINLLKPYYPQIPSPSQGGGEVLPVAVAVLDTGPSCQSLVAAEVEEIGPEDAVLQPRLNYSAVLASLDTLLDLLPSDQADEFKALILTFPVLLDTLRCTDLLKHGGEALPFRQHFNRVGPDKNKVLDAEVLLVCLITNLLEGGVRLGRAVKWKRFFVIKSLLSTAPVPAALAGQAIPTSDGCWGSAAAG
ncbi:uncharacterized protein LOC134094065 [Sardina pilchardus]|uniref:uncharacterized protein LOC134094065 n=1 Tax=Sardina pilchardus TaxID=27697 RepID=UPI002E167157